MKDITFGGRPKDLERVIEFFLYQAMPTVAKGEHPTLVMMAHTGRPPTGTGKDKNDDIGPGTVTIKALDPGDDPRPHLESAILTGAALVGFVTTANVRVAVAPGQPPNEPTEHLYLEFCSAVATVHRAFEIVTATDGTRSVKTTPTRAVGSGITRNLPWMQQIIMACSAFRFVTVN